MKPLTASEIQALMRKAQTLEQFHALSLMYVQVLKEKYKHNTYSVYQPKNSV